MFVDILLTQIFVTFGKSISWGERTSAGNFIGENFSNHQTFFLFPCMLGYDNEFHMSICFQKFQVK